MNIRKLITKINMKERRKFIQTHHTHKKKKNRKEV